MFKRTLLGIFLIFALLSQSITKRVHFDAEAASVATTPAPEVVENKGNSEQSKTTESAQNNPPAVAEATPTGSASEEQAPKEPQQEQVAEQKQIEPILLNSTTTAETTTSTNETVAETARQGSGQTGGEVTKQQTAEPSSLATTNAANENTVPISDLQSLSTKELTLNLSSLKFPDPKRQGDTLNLSGITISSSSLNSAAKKCQAGYASSSDGKSCQLAEILLMTNLDAQNLILGDLNIEDLKAKQAEFKTKNPSFTAIQCSGATPFLTKQGCIACNNPNTLFSLKSLKCSKCPEGSKYNAESRNCESGGEKYVSNLEASNYLVLPGQSLDDYKNQIEEFKKQHPHAQVCPLDKPYSTGSQCVSCPSSKPLFFVASKSCTACQANSTYNSKVHSCLGKKYKVTTITTTSSKQSKQSNKQRKSKQDSSSSDDKKKKREDKDE